MKGCADERYRARAIEVGIHQDPVTQSRTVSVQSTVLRACEAHAHALGACASEGGEKTQSPRGS